MPERKFGRPPLPSEKARSHRVVTFLTTSELEELKRLAATQNQTVSAAAHRILAASLKK